jgi:hypothetical protein
VSDRDLLALFAELRQDIDSVPFAHEDLWSGDYPTEIGSTQ